MDVRMNTLFPQGLSFDGFDDHADPDPRGQTARDSRSLVCLTPLA
jgi:hypothetical protein